MYTSAAALTTALILSATTGITLTASTYYIDAGSGNDANTGRSSAKPWKSLAKVNGFANFRSGDQILFKRGSTWTGTLELSLSSATIGAYGSGALPKIAGPAVTCVHVTGSNLFIADLRASNCAWAGFELTGDGNVLNGVQADNNVAGVSIVEGSDWNEVRWSTLVDNNKMSVDDDTHPYDDSGAFGVALAGSDNAIRHNTITGSFHTSHDFGYDGSAVEIYNANRNHVEYNRTADNDTFTELGHEPGKTADDNVFAYNSVTSTEPTGLFLVTRGARSQFGPVRRTLAINNSVDLPHGAGWSCDAGCGPGILKLRNNVVKVGGTVGFDDSFVTGNPADGADDDRGVYQGSAYQFTLGPHSVRTDPLWTTDFRLRTNSPAIARAENSGYAYDLAGKPLAGLTHWDSGAYQH